MSGSELRKLPGIDRLLNEADGVRARQEFGHELAVATARRLLDATRADIVAHGARCPSLPELAGRLLEELRRTVRPTLRPLINATGVIIHTNLGRAPLSDAARAAMQQASAGYSNLEYDLETGQRGSRYGHAVELLRQLTGAEDALVVNNNAAAVLLCLTALARDREVIISRGQLVEIGGGFRVFEVLQASGARLVEVGATNRTHLADYRDAIGPATAALLRVHSSNFRQIGFTADVDLPDLAALGREHGLPVVDDLGSGSLLDTTAHGLSYEPRVQDSIRAGATLVTFSGDKLLGGPQAGLIVGSRAAVARLLHHPLTRALRVDKTTLAALAATLDHYLRGEATTQIPVWRMITASAESLHGRAERWAATLRAAGIAAEVRAGQSTVGGGSLPGDTLPTALLALPGLPATRLAGLLRAGEPPVIARITNDTLVLDPRTVGPEDDEALLRQVVQAARAAGPEQPKAHE